MMIFRGNGLHCIAILMMQLSFMTIAKAIHETVTVRIKNGDEIIDLNWRRTEKYLVNRNLPVWEAVQHAEPRLTSNMFEKTGEFIAYHDVEKSSAVVYLTSFNCFYGIIDTRFYVAGLPLPTHLESDIYYDVGGDYIIARGEATESRHFHNGPNSWLLNLFTDTQFQYINSLIDSMDVEMSTINNIPCASTQDVEAQSSIDKILYPEILVFITYDIYETFRKANEADSVALLISYYVLYFNAIDMMFAKLATDEIKIHINIAGFVLETKCGALPNHFSQCPGLIHGEISYCLQGDNVLIDYQKYINKHRTIFVEDSFDFFFISTTRAILSDDSMVNAQSTPFTSIFAQRIMHHSEVKFLGLIVRREVALGDYVAATREIAKLMNIKTNQPGIVSFDGSQECFFIMQKGETHCQNCLKWSDESRNDFNVFVRFDLNHCFLLNYPRSLYPYGEPILSIPPEDQCLCYNFPPHSLNPFYMVSIPSFACNKPIQCMYDQDARILTPLPLDGTPCSSSNKVCWRKRCLGIGQTSSSRK